MLLAAMTSHQLVLLGAAACVGGAIFGIVGFAFGVIASLFLHHGYPAADVIFIVVAGALVLNLGLLPKFWGDIDFRKSVPYLAGATVGLPIGLALLYLLDPRLIRLFVSVLLVSYCLFALRQQSREPLRLSHRHGRTADVAIGVAGGVVGGISGLGPLLPGIWYGLRGMSKTEQRALTQPFGLYVQGLMVAWFLATGTVSTAALQSVAIATPVMLVAAWLGLLVFDGLSTVFFQRSVIATALLGSVFLLLRQL
ncbi:MAG: permease [Rhizobacter sp.]|jgi:uncharacterized membrane protein YfcA|nr:permease [Rhizobacter sp.]